MNNAKIASQIELAYRACEELTGARVLIRSVEVSQRLGQPTIVCIAAHARDVRMHWCAGCRLVWTSPDQATETGIEARVDVCRVCQCTDLSACQHEDGSPCFWIQPELCSVCAEGLGVDVDAHRNLGAEADVGHAIAGAPRGELPR